MNQNFIYRTTGINLRNNVKRKRQTQKDLGSVAPMLQNKENQTRYVEMYTQVAKVQRKAR